MFRNRRDWEAGNKIGVSSQDSWNANTGGVSVYGLFGEQHDGGKNSMIERIVPPLVLRRTIIGSEAARVMPKSLERTAARISKNQEISSLFLVCRAINAVFHSKYFPLVHKNMALSRFRVKFISGHVVTAQEISDGPNKGRQVRLIHLDSRQVAGGSLPSILDS